MQLLVSDYDGTFHTSNTDKSTIQLNNKKITEWMADGNLFMLSSGRSFNSLLGRIIEEGIPVDFLCSADGSHLFDRNKNVLFEKYMDIDILNNLESIIKLGVHSSIQYSTRFEYVEELPSNNMVSSINLVVNAGNLTREFINEWKRLKATFGKKYNFLDYGYDDIIYFCIKPKGIDKSSPIKHLEVNSQLLKRDIFTVGDSVNDRSMIRDYNGYRIGNNKSLSGWALGTYPELHYLIDDIMKQKVKKRYI